MASSVSSAYSICDTGDTLCEIRVYEQEVIIVPVLFLMSFFVTLLFLLLLRFCPEKVDRLQPSSIRTKRNRRNLQGIDAPLGLNALEGEHITLDTTSYMTFSTSSPVQKQYRSDHASFNANNVAFPDGQGSFGATASAFTKPKELPRQRLPENFNGVSPLPVSYSLKSDSSVSLYRARMENRNVVLRVLKDSASNTESQSFLGFAAFLSQLGPHPFLPELLGVVSLRAPLITVIEEMENQDLLGFLWRCRQDNGGPNTICQMTEKKIFTMASHVSSALDYLHSKDLLHCNIKACSVLVSQMCTAKLWGLGDLYSRTLESANYSEDPGRKKWQAPEILAKRPVTPKSDVWSFGLLLYEMVTLGEVPFAEIPVKELLQYHQRAKTLKKPNNCSNSLYSIIKSCCQWKEQERPSLADVRHKLQSGEKNANDSIILRVPGPINIEQYLKEAGYGESNSYTIF
ncbi:tyrosine-protein kinase STYK1b [Xyrauchen texanus]|uniref:tyrosine-protein kinase STYK1b n=1 Tax=Xyrauchen texanus TaxID=154827 RepID=UPI002242589F|nr:tyrosine-protein kinase STYK1b [Xyrauchen texanus]XP_052000059.1 tyrosine-protein kinase STYK1b [Xyrauchen texanus]